MNFEQLAPIYLLALLQLIAIGALLAASWRLSGWLWPQRDWAVRLVATGTTFCSLAVLLVILPGVLGLLQPLLLGAAVVALWVLVRWCVPAPSPLPALDVPRSVHGPLLLAGLVAAPFLARSLLLVELTWDSLVYHLFFPAVWIQQQRVFLVDGVIPLNYVAFYPKNYELILTFLMGIARNELFVKLVNLPLLGLTAVVTGLISYQLAGSRRVAWCAGLFALTVPAQFCWAATTYVEPLLNFSLLAAVYFVCRAWQAEPGQLWRTGILAGLALGLAVGTKYTALYMAVLLVLVVVALAADRRLAWRAIVSFWFAFAGGSLLTGSWWLAINTAVTGNPVYPNVLGFLPHMIDRDQPGVMDTSIWNSFGRLIENGELFQAWFGDLWTEIYFADDPTQLGFGPKLLLLIPSLALGLSWCVWRALSEARRGAVASAAPYLTVVAATLVATFTYLKIPSFGGSLYFQLRFASPIMLLGTAMGFAVLARLGQDRLAIILVWLGLILDAFALDLRFPETSRRVSVALLAAVFIVMIAVARFRWLRCQMAQAAAARKGASGDAGVEQCRTTRAGPPPARRPGCRLVLGAALPGLMLALFGVLYYRENNRYYQYANCYEVHDGCPEPHAALALWLQTEHPGEPIAYTGTFAALLYLYVGPQLDRPVFYVPTCEGPVASYVKHGELRDVVDRTVWEKNLKASGARLLIVFRLFRFFWTEEDQWARELAFPLLRESEYYRVYQVTFPGAGINAGGDELTGQE